MARSTKINGKKLREARESLYITQAALGERIGGMSDENVGRIERANPPQGIHTSKLPALAKALGWPIERVVAELVVPDKNAKAPARMGPKTVSLKLPRELLDEIKRVADREKLTVIDYLARVFTPTSSTVNREKPVEPVTVIHTGHRAG